MESTTPLMGLSGRYQHFLWNVILRKPAIHRVQALNFFFKKWNGNQAKLCILSFGCQSGAFDWSKHVFLSTERWTVTDYNAISFSENSYWHGQFVGDKICRTFLITLFNGITLLGCWLIRFGMVSRLSLVVGLVFWIPHGWGGYIFGCVSWIVWRLW